jgi:hypothetical protein
VELELDDLSAPELIATGNRLVDGLAGNPNFPDPKPTLSELKQKLEDLEEAQETYRKLRLQLNEMKVDLYARMRAVKNALNVEAAYVQEASHGDAKSIISAHLAAERSWHFWPFASLPQVNELSATIGEKPGEIDLVWDRVHGADGYELESSTDIAGEGAWEKRAVASESRVTVKGLDPHCRYWFRVRAIGEKGRGEWSDPVTKYSR